MVWTEKLDNVVDEGKSSQRAYRVASVGRSGATTHLRAADLLSMAPVDCVNVSGEKQAGGERQ